MCGIAGIMILDGAARPLASAAAAMGACMQRRGPDDEGYLLAWLDERPARPFAGPDSIPGPDDRDREPFVASASGTPAQVALVHRRLAIIDRSAAGRQPMRSADGRYWIVYNGEIYNFPELARELAGEGVRFAGRSDTEVLLAGFVRWGPGVLDRCNGMFAFAVWDDLRKEILLARDRVGIKPLYYTIDGGRLLFGSDVKTILASGLHAPRVDDEGLYHALSFGVAPRPLTAFSGVRSLEPGHWLRVTPAGIQRKHRYWRIPVGTQDLSMSADAAAESLEAHLRRAVRLNLVSDVPVGVFMSGGLDSGVVGAMAGQAHPDVTALTLGFRMEDARRDEIPLAQATTERYGMRHVVRRVAPEAAIHHVRAMVLCYEEPHYSLSPNYLVSQLAAESGMTVVLNGLGGDELFAGYSHYRWARWWPLLGRLPGLAAVVPAGSRRLATLSGKLAALRSAGTADRLHTALYSKQSEARKRRLFPAAARAGYDTPERVHALYVGDDVEFTDTAEALSYMDLVNYLGNHQVYRLDQFTMRFSLEGRFPLLDHELIEAAFRIPTRHKLRGGRGKQVLRRVARNHLPEACFSLPKQGFGLPMRQWLRGPLREMATAKLRALAGRGIFDADEVLARSAAFFAGGSLPYTEIWQMVAVELWLEEFMDPAPALGSPRMGTAAGAAGAAHR
jgi:asparagine synthase (glutamine-hydrolysing)